MAHEATLTRTTDPIQKSGVFSRDAIEAISNRRNEPDWMREKRQVAWTVFEETPMPTSADEDWRRTDLRKVKWDRFNFASPASFAAPKTLADLPEDIRDALEEKYPAAGRIVLANDQVIYREIDPALAEKGVVFTSLSTAVQEHPELVQKYLGAEAVPPSNSKFAALNAALWQGGCFCTCPKTWK